MWPGIAWDFSKRSGTSPPERGPHYLSINALDLSKQGVGKNTLIYRLVLCLSPKYAAG